MDKIKFKSGLGQINIPIDDINIEQFCSFEKLLLEWNEKFNLTAITDNFGIMTKHFLDSLLPLSAFEVPQNAGIIDVGTGAGFPGIPIKLARSDLSVTLLDSLNKRVNFLCEVAAKLDLKECTPIHGRAEVLGKSAEYREKFDIATSRAVASLDMLAEFCLPFVKVGGVFLALKSEDSEEETKSAQSIVAALGGDIENEITAKIPYTDIVRKIIIIRKIKNTPAEYPRAMSKIKKKP